MTMTLWNIHKYAHNKVTRLVCRWAQRTFFNGADIFTQYHQDIRQSQSAVAFIVTNRELITTMYGHNVVRELIINYRTRFGTSRPTKLFDDFQKYVVSKVTVHSSDLAIACNMLKNITLTPAQQQAVLQFVVDRLGDRLDPTIAALGSNRFSVKKQLVIEKVRSLGKYTQ